MKRVSILGGGIAGLAAAYELEKRRLAGEPLDWHLFEASSRFGGTVQTTRYTTDDGEWILEDGPDAWVTEKPWARELAEELGLGEQVIASNDAGKKTYIWMDGQLVAMPDRMRMMVPEDLSTLETSVLFSSEAKAAYASELQRAAELKGSAPTADESVADFVRRHFGEEVLAKIGAPLLSGVFGGDVAKLSVRSVMPNFTRMEAEHGSLIAAMEASRRARGGRPPMPTFTTLRRGMGLLVEAVVATLPMDRMHTGVQAAALQPRTGGGWLVRFAGQDAASCAIGFVPFDHVLLATSGDVARQLLQPIDADAAALIPQHASSAVLATFCWPSSVAKTFTVPPGFGFLVPQEGMLRGDRPRLLAGTFTTQKFANRAPEGGRIVRVFFGGEIADALCHRTDEQITSEAWRELQAVLPHIPAADPTLRSVARWPRSLPQYEVGHGDRMQQLNRRVGALRDVTLLGNGYRGVGVPDLIRDARGAARNLEGNTI